MVLYWRNYCVNLGPTARLDYDELKPRLTALVKSHEDDMARADKLEQKMASLMQKHATHVSRAL